MSATWVMDVSSMVYARIVSEFSEKIKKDYNMTEENFSTESSSDVDAVFPFVFIQFLPEAPEVGRTLEGDTINGGIFTFQIEVTDNQYQQRANRVMGECLRIMKKMCFETTMPSPGTEEGVKKSLCRFRREIDANDKW